MAELLAEADATILADMVRDAILTSARQSGIIHAALVAIAEGATTDTVRDILTGIIAPKL